MVLFVMEPAVLGMHNALIVTVLMESVLSVIIMETLDPIYIVMATHAQPIMIAHQELV